jgi:SAM-dependent methyltransferase
VLPVQDAEYTIEKARKYGWGPEATPNQERANILQKYAIGPLVLDVGCASGAYVNLLARGGLRAVGVDASAELLRAGAGHDGLFVLGRAEALPFAAEAFDTTVLFALLEHVDDRAVLCEAVRVTRRRILALVPIADPAELVRNGFLFLHHVDRTHRREYTEEALRGLFESCGCEVVATERAYAPSVRGLFVESLRLPRPLRFLVRALLRERHFRNYFSEIFLVADANPERRRRADRPSQVGSLNEAQSTPVAAGAANSP